MLSRFHIKERESLYGRPPQRLVDKHGRANIIAEGIRGWRKRYMYDFFTTMVDIRWRWNILIFVGGFVVTWSIFAFAYWIVAFFNGDYEIENTFNDTTHKPCFKNMHSFLSAYLFSIETQSTIGYGFIYVTEECLIAYTCVLIQSIVGAALQAALAGLVVAKVRRGRKDNNTIMFSNSMCIFADGLKLKLVLRVADARKIHSINTNVKGYLFKKIVSEEGKPIPLNKQDIVNFNVEGGCNGLFLAWPQQIIHTIDEKSPFWKLDKESLLKENFELVVVFFGEIATVGRPFETEVSYLPWDIKWGCKFQPMQHKIDNTIDKYFVDIANFNKIIQSPTPTCSAENLKSAIDKDSSNLPDYIKENVNQSKHSPIFSRQDSVADKYFDTPIKRLNESPLFCALPQ